MKNESTEEESRNSSNPKEIQKQIEKDARNEVLSKSPMRQPTQKQMSRKEIPNFANLDLTN